MLEMKEDDKFFTRLLSKESSTANPSFRVYYGGVPIGVPFVWEAKPGTPKHPSFSASAPRPLTPPPSYSSSSSSASLGCPKKSISPPKKGRMMLQGLFPKMMTTRHRRQVSSASTSTSSSCSDSVMRRSRSVSSSGGTVFDFAVNVRDPEEEEEEEVGGMMSDERSPRSILCFGFVAAKKIRSPSVA